VQAVLAGMAEPWVIAVVPALTTLLLEDLAIAAGVAVALPIIVLAAAVPLYRHLRIRFKRPQGQTP